MANPWEGPQMLPKLQIEDSGEHGDEGDGDRDSEDHPSGIISIPEDPWQAELTRDRTKILEAISAAIHEELDKKGTGTLECSESDLRFMVGKKLSALKNNVNGLRIGSIIVSEILDKAGVGVQIIILFKGRKDNPNDWHEVIYFTSKMRLKV